MVINLGECGPWGIGALQKSITNMLYYPEHIMFGLIGSNVMGAFHPIYNHG